MRNNREEFAISKARIDMSNLRHLRLSKGYSQVKMQHLVGVSDSSIQAYEEKKRIPSLPVAYRLAEVLGVSLDYLVGRSNELEKYYTLSKADKDKVLELIDSLAKNNN